MNNISNIEHFYVNNLYGNKDVTIHFSPTGIVAITVLVAPSMTETVSSNAFAV